MKDGAKEIVGKEITGVIVAKNALRDPRTQMFLVFGDGTHFEIYGNQFTGAGGVDRGDAETVTKYVTSNGGEVVASYRKSAPAPQTSEVLTPSRAFDVKPLLWVVYWLGNIATFAKLTFFSGYHYTSWNWLIVVPINEFLAAIWPIYWAILHPLMGA